MDPSFILIAVVFAATITIVRLALVRSARARRRTSQQLHHFDFDGADGRRVQRIQKRNRRGFD